MDDLLAARLQMAMSLGFHIVFAAIGMALPILISIAHTLWLRTRNVVYQRLTKAWTKGLAIFFATGAVSGTALSFELGLLWPEFMQHAGPIFGMPFSWEGTAFFLEAIFLGLFLYGWNRVPERIHWLSGIAVGACGMASAYFVICANAWMNAPTGFDWNNGNPTNIDPVAAMFNARSLDMGIHMILASLAATGFAVAGLHALQLLRRPKHAGHLAAIKIALMVGGPAALLLPISGDFTAKQTAKHQPLKLAAMEAHFDTEAYAPLVIGGIPSEVTESVEYAIKIPGLLSFLAFGDPAHPVQGLKDFPRELWPPLKITHFAFQTMVGMGSVMALSFLVLALLYYRRRTILHSPLILRWIALLTPSGFIAIEAGWTVTEVGRQPWIIYGFMKTYEALSPMTGLVYTFYFYCALYLSLTLIVIWLMLRQLRVYNGDQIAAGGEGYA